MLVILLRLQVYKRYRCRYFCDPAVNAPLTAQPIDPPTVTMSFLVNDSPLAGTEGDKVTSRVIRDRLLKEAEGNVALKIEESADKDSFYVSGRGELQLAVLIENMRREGFELSVSRPRVVMQKGENGTILEPIEEVVIDVDEEYSGTVVQKCLNVKVKWWNYALLEVIVSALFLCAHPWTHWLSI